MMEDIKAFQATPVGTPESDALGLKLVENMTGNLLFIGTVKEQKPIYHSAALKNVHTVQDRVLCLLPDVPLPSVAVVPD